jgi:hypothetical protein
MSTVDDEFRLLLIRNIRRRRRRQSIVWPLINSRRMTARPFEWAKSLWFISRQEEDEDEERWDEATTQKTIPVSIVPLIFQKGKFWRADDNEDQNFGTEHHPAVSWNQFCAWDREIPPKNNNIARQIQFVSFLFLCVFLKTIISCRQALPCTLSLRLDAHTTQYIFIYIYLYWTLSMCPPPFFTDGSGAAL